MLRQNRVEMSVYVPIEQQEEEHLGWMQLAMTMVSQIRPGFRWLSRLLFTVGGRGHEV